MFISKKEEFKFKIIKKGQYSTLISINDRVNCLKKISNSIKNFALEKKNNELIALCYFLEESTKESLNENIGGTDGHFPKNEN